MSATSSSPKNRLSELLTSYQFWLIAAILIISAFLHYTAQIRATPIALLGASPYLTRHAVERVLFVLPIAYAALTFGLVGGLLTLFIAVLIMLPRILFVSPYPLDALFEMGAVILVGGLVSWLAEIQKRDRVLRQMAITELKAVNAISVIVSQSLELEPILDSALQKVLEVMALQPRAGIFLRDPETQELHLKVHRGLSEEFVREESVIPMGECLCGFVAQSGEALFLEEGCEDCDLRSEDARHTRMREMKPHAHLIVPLKAKDEVLGVMFFYPQSSYRSDARSMELLTSIGNQIGIAIENSRLYERERLASERSRISEEELRSHVRHITRAQEDERKRMARELHDDTAQALLFLSRRLDALTTFHGGLPELVIRRLEELRELASSILQGIRRFSQDLRPPVLDDLGLLPALEGVTTDLFEKDGIETKLEAIGDRRRLSSETELVLFRITQEALRNVKKHSQASVAEVTVEFSDTRVRIKISDNGKGFEPPERVVNLAQIGKMGLIGMQERAQLLGGTLTLRSAPGQGTTVVVDLPV